LYDQLGAAKDHFCCVMSQTAGNNEYDRRPECMATLGLSPPYTLEDVKAAYYSKARRLHPDHGGSAENFRQLHNAFEQAQEYVAYCGDRRGWIASKMDGYVSLLAAVERVEALGASTISTNSTWLENSIGDFAQLTETVSGVRLVDSPNGDELVQVLLEELPVLKSVTTIEMPGCRVSDNAVLQLVAYRGLRRLDLSRTPVTARTLVIVDALPHLTFLALEGSAVGLWARRRTERRLRSRTSKTAEVIRRLPHFFKVLHGEATQ
jgi:hypothetical protein